MTAVYNIEIKEGEKVAMLFSPRLYSFRGKEGVTLVADGADAVSVYGLYADMMYCAALNHWTLTHDGDEEFPFHRIDFHAFSASNRKSFEKAMIFAMETLSGKSVRELIEDAKKGKESGKESEQETQQEEVKKKSLRSWITNLLKLS